MWYIGSGVEVEVGIISTSSSSSTLITSHASVRHGRSDAYIVDSERKRKHTNTHTAYSSYSANSARLVTARRETLSNRNVVVHKFNACGPSRPKPNDTHTYPVPRTPKQIPRLDYNTYNTNDYLITRVLLLIVLIVRLLIFCL